jgi:hypothetical protein
MLTNFSRERSSMYRQRRIFAVLVFVFMLAVGLSISDGDYHPHCPGAAENECCWSGTAPLCSDKCPSGRSDTGTASIDADGGLRKCVTGTHRVCCPTPPPPTSCFWHHTAPICSNSECPSGSVRTGEPSDCGDGKCCATGKKILCCS